MHLDKHEELCCFADVANRSFDNVDHKVAEAEFFLRLLSNPKTSFPEVDWYLSAFISASRSITFVLQAVMESVNGFQSWYAAKQGNLAQNPLAQYFVHLRNFAQKTGAQVVNRYTFSSALASLVKTSPERLFVRPSLWFGECGEKMPSPPTQSVPEACRCYFLMLLNLIYDCYVDFGPEVDPQQRYTPEFFSSIGKSVEDAEMELGLPRGWTDIGRPEALPYRFEMLRRHAGVCGINFIFSEYLGKTTPAPNPLPPFPIPEGEGWQTLKNGSRVWIPEQLRKTGDPDKDLEEYIATLRADRLSELS